MGDRKPSDHDRAREAAARLKRADAQDAAAKSNSLSGHELIEAAKKANAVHIQAIHDSRILETLLPAIDVQKMPGGYIALFRIEDIGISPATMTSAKGFTALEAINAGKPSMNVRMGRRYIFPQPHKLILALEQNGFALSGQLLTYKNEILEDAIQRGQYHGKA